MKTSKELYKKSIDSLLEDIEDKMQLEASLGATHCTYYYPDESLNLLNHVKDKLKENGFFFNFDETTGELYIDWDEEGKNGN